MPAARRQPSRSSRRFFDDRNRSIRIDLFEELSDQALAALRSFTRRMGAPHLLEEVILPILHEGDSQILAAVQDRPWPPWGLGARHVVALCQTHSIADESYAISPVYVTDEDLTNVGMISAVFKEALEQVAISPRAEVCYLVAEGSLLVDDVLTSVGFRKSEDIFLNWAGRYYTYRALAGDLVKGLGLDRLSTPDLLAHDMNKAILAKNALFHQTLYLGSRAEWAAERAISEIIRLVRGGHASKPGGVPSGTGRFAFDPESILEISVANFLGPEDRQKLLDYVISQEDNFKPATVIQATSPTVNEKVRRAKTLDKLGEFEAKFAERIKEQLQPVLNKLGHKAFQMGRIEMQITASNDGDYFRLHQDSDPKSTREISFVYFFHREPRRFSGGELRIYQGRLVDDRVVPADQSHTLSPRQDTIVFFPSLNEHEVLPVRVPSRSFGDSRLTLNGWIHRQ
jgi:Rps23 Pro-64 3,4-dihydroxylase Tpa1-like proline 4-hydroxylase